MSTRHTHHMPAIDVVTTSKPRGIKIMADIDSAIAQRQGKDRKQFAMLLELMQEMSKAIQLNFPNRRRMDGAVQAIQDICGSSYWGEKR